MCRRAGHMFATSVRKLDAHPKFWFAISPAICAPKLWVQGAHPPAPSCPVPPRGPRSSTWSRAEQQRPSQSSTGPTGACAVRTCTTQENNARQIVNYHAGYLKITDSNTNDCIFKTQAQVAASAAGCSCTATVIDLPWSALECPRTR